MLGANARYWLTNLFLARLGPALPFGTLFINITGSFLLGLILTVAANRLTVEPIVRLTVGTGFLGAYTTFSAFSVDTVTLVERGDLVPALLYAVGSLVGSILAAYLGVVLGRAVG